MMGGVISSYGLYPPVPNLLAWLVSDDAHNDGSNKCDSLVDRVGGATFSQATSGNRFSIATSGTRRVLGNGTGGTTRLRLESTDSRINTIPVGTGTFALFSYVRQVTLTVQQYLAGWQASGTPTGDRANALLGNGATSGGGVKRNGTAYIKAGGTRTASVWQSHCMAYQSGTNGVTYWLNGTNIGTATPAGTIASDVDTAVWGCSGSGNAMKGDYGALGIFASVPSDADVLVMHNWCAQFFI
jgi:hypothetical protein